MILTQSYLILTDGSYSYLGNLKMTVSQSVSQGHKIVLRDGSASKKVAVKKFLGWNHVGQTHTWIWFGAEESELDEHK